VCAECEEVTGDNVTHTDREVERREDKNGRRRRVEHDREKEGNVKGDKKRDEARDEDHEAREAAEVVREG